MQAIEDYCKGLEVENSRDLNEKAYWFLDEIKEHPYCQYSNCHNYVKFYGLRNGYAATCCASHASLYARPKVEATNLKKFGSTTPLQGKEIRA